MVRIPGLAVLLVVVGVGHGKRVIDVRALGAITLAQLIRLRVGGQDVRVVHLSRLAALEEGPAEEAGLCVAGGVVVGGRWAETLLLLAVAAEPKLGQGRDDEKDAGGTCQYDIWL